MSFHDILQWWNLIYVAPLFVSVVWIVATLFSGVHAGGGGHAVSHGIGHAAHGIGHVAHDIGHAVGHAVHHGDAGAGHDAAHATHGHDAARARHGHGAHAVHTDAHQESFGSRVLSVLGIGQVPITLIFGIFMLFWGALGMTTNQFLAGILKFPLIYIWPSLGITFVVSFAVTRSLIAVIARCMPNTETYGVSRMELIGSLGRAIYPTTESAGTVDIKDTYGTLHRVQAKTEAGRRIHTVGLRSHSYRF